MPNLGLMLPAKHLWGLSNMVRPQPIGVANGFLIVIRQPFGICPTANVDSTVAIFLKSERTFLLISIL